MLQTAHLLAYCMYSLATNPDKQDILVAEIDEHFPNKAEVSDNDMKTMTYIKACIKETHR
jgi:cytochrome P450